MPKTATLRPLDADELSQLHIALTARIEELGLLSADDPDAVTPELMSMLSQLNYDITEARRTL
jgi:hypothetical protein